MNACCKKNQRQNYFIGNLAKMTKVLTFKLFLYYLPDERTNIKQKENKNTHDFIFA